MNVDYKVRFARGDQDVSNIFHFLCIVAQPVMLGPVNKDKALAEIGRLVEDPYRTDGPAPTGFAIVAEIDGELVGTIGVTLMDDWYSDRQFMTNRWFFVFPTLANSGVGGALMAEAHAMSNQIGFDLAISGKLVRRNRAIWRGVLFEKGPRLLRAGDTRESMQ
jgi:GNAT superfamily N-acetyltransferase